MDATVNGLDAKVHYQKISCCPRSRLALTAVNREGESNDGHVTIKAPKCHQNEGK